MLVSFLEFYLKYMVNLVRSVRRSKAKHIIKYARGPDEPKIVSTIILYGPTFMKVEACKRSINNDWYSTYVAINIIYPYILL